MPKQLKVGDSVLCNGFKGVVVRVGATPGGCIEVRLPGGVAYVDPDDCTLLT